MKVYEFETVVDAQKDLLRLHNRPSRARIKQLSENPITAQVIDNFLNFAEQYNVKEENLIVGNNYLPLEISYSLAELKITIITTISPVVFVSKFGSRLFFENKSNKKQITFPADGFIADNSRRFIATTKSNLDIIIQQYALVFSAAEWDKVVYGYEPTTMDLSKITNIC